MGALEREAGLTRDVIHHYVKLGLIPAPEKSNATVSWYDERHLAALKRVRAMKARGLSLGEIKRFLDGPSDAMGLADLDAAASLLASTERPTVARAALSAECVALVDAMGFTEAPRVTAALAEALSRLARCAPAEAVRASLAACSDAVERTAEAVHRARVAALTSGDDPVTSALEASAAMGAALDAWRAQREHTRTEATLRDLSDAARNARRSQWLSPSPAATEGASLRVVVLDRAIEAAPHDPAPHAERARLLLGASSSRRAGDAARASRSLGVEGPWITLALGVAALDRDACDEAARRFEEALAARPSWGLAEALRRGAVGRRRGGRDARGRAHRAGHAARRRPPGGAAPHGPRGGADVVVAAARLRPSRRGDREAARGGRRGARGRRRRPHARHRRARSNRRKRLALPRRSARRRGERL